MKNITQSVIKKYLVDVVPFYPIDGLFTYVYECPQNVDLVGYRVLIPFKSKRILGIIFKEHEGELDFDESLLKKVIKVLDERPIVSSKMLELCKWLSEYYVTPIGEVVKTVVPSRLKNIETRYVQLIGIQKFEKLLLNKFEKKIIDFLESRKTRISLRTISKSLKIPNLETTLETLQKKGIIKIFRKEDKSILKKQVYKINKELFCGERFSEFLEILKKKKNLVSLLNYLYEQSNLGINLFTIKRLKEVLGRGSIGKYINELVDMGFLIPESFTDYETKLESQKIFNFPNELEIPLTEQQNSVLSDVMKKIGKEEFSSFLLFGVTGSGKTLIYLHCIKKCLELGRSVIVLVPEISLTPQLIERFENAFPNQIAVLHSRLSELERNQQWLSILEGEKKIVVGARSAIFAPTQNLGLIIVDEEHEPTYKQDEPAPRYNARDVALIRGKFENCVVLLGSATPSVNSFFAAKQGKHKLLTIDQRADGAKLPNVVLVDMIEKRTQRKVFGQFSDALIHKVIDRLNKKEGVILFQNRRGFGLLLECRYCGYIPKCPECEVSLTFHKIDQKLKCHYCGFEKYYQPSCPICGKSPMLVLGYGTQRVEEELKKILNEFGYYPKIERFDLDVVLKAPERNGILQKFYYGEIDIIVGTQLIAKGLDFERVTLVGIINADLQLNIPDYSANERAFQLFTQVAGRAGRRSSFPGEVIIQTTSPKSYPIEAFINNDYLSFYHKEIFFRRELHYPPFYRLISLEIRWKSEEIDPEILAFVKSKLDTFENVFVLGPVTPILHKVRGWNRKVFLLKVNRSRDPNLKRTSNLLKEFQYEFIRKFHTKGIKLIIDVDAQFSLL
ncbi:MAG: primosomal protein N' [Ignavibacteria bacterium]|nr:primosomal protein N' [Ignavibacteria bacterium]